MALTKITGELIETSPTLNTSITLTSTDAGSSAGPDLILYRNSSSPADADYLGQIQFKGRHDGSGDEIYAKVTGKISDASSGTEDGLIETAVKGNGSFVIVSRQKSDTLQLLNGVGIEVAGDATISGAFTSQGIDDNADATAITIDSSEKVGIGDTSPDAMLKVVSNSATVVGSWIRGDQYGLRVSGGSTSSHYALRIANSSDSTLATFNGDGKAGIGTHAPVVMLDVRGEVAVDYNATYGLRFYNQSRNNWSSIGNPQTSSNADMVFKTGGGEAMKILHNGRVGIGTSSPAYHFHLKDTGNGTIYQMEATGGNNIYKAFTNTGGTSYIGTENQDWKLYVGGSVKFEVTSSGGQSVSDQKFKKDIEDISYGLDTVKALQPRKFTWKDSEEDSIGFIAQEVQPIISEVINVPTVTPPEGMETGMSMNYSALTAVLTKAIQELSTKLEAAEARITTLEG